MPLLPPDLRVIAPDSAGTVIPPGRRGIASDLPAM
jgi:hypothetical protein